MRLGLVLEAAVPLRASRRQDVELDAEPLAGVLELGHELAAAIDLDGLHRHGQGIDDGVEEALGVEGGGAGEDAGDHEAAERADGAAHGGTAAA